MTEHPDAVPPIDLVERLKKRLIHPSGMFDTLFADAAAEIERQRENERRWHVQIADNARLIAENVRLLAELADRQEDLHDHQDSLERAQEVIAKLRAALDWISKSESDKRLRRIGVEGEGWIACVECAIAALAPTQEPPA